MSAAIYDSDPIMTGVESALNRLDRHGLGGEINPEALVSLVNDIYLSQEYSPPSPVDSERRRLENDLMSDVIATAFIAYGRQGEAPPQRLFRGLRELIRRILNGLAEPE